MRFILLLFKCYIFFWGLIVIPRSLAALTFDWHFHIFGQVVQMWIIFQILITLCYISIGILFWQKMRHWKNQLLPKKLFSFAFQSSTNHKLLDKSILFFIITSCIIYVIGTGYHIAKVAMHKSPEVCVGDFQ